MPLNPFLATKHADRFQEPGVIARYHLRLPYPQETFDFLLSLITSTPRVVLDVGTGTGELARQLVEHVDRVDAVDCSAAMLEKGRTLPQGMHPHLHWMCGRIEDVQLTPPYSLIVAGDSTIWLDWEIVFPRFAALLAPQGCVAMLERRELPAPWQSELQALIRRYSTIKYYPALDIVATLEQAHLFAKVGEKETAPVTTKQSITDYIASFHSRSSLSLDYMPPQDAAAFDQALRALVEPWSHEDELELQTVARIIWGKPLQGSYQA
jgi:trans-aconitate methyltransferase